MLAAWLSERAAIRGKFFESSDASSTFGVTESLCTTAWRNSVFEAADGKGPANLALKASAASRARRDRAALSSAAKRNSLRLTKETNSGTGTGACTATGLGAGPVSDTTSRFTFDGNDDAITAPKRIVTALSLKTFTPNAVLSRASSVVADHTPTRHDDRRHWRWRTLVIPLTPNAVNLHLQPRQERGRKSRTREHKQRTSQGRAGERFAQRSRPR